VWECEPGLESFRAEVQAYYEKSAIPKLSKWKITLTFCSLGLFALIIAIIALVKTYLAKQTFEKLLETDSSFKKTASTFRYTPPAEQKRLLKEHLENQTSIAKQFFAYIEGVPSWYSSCAQS
jgi:hypothetical protein